MAYSIDYTASFYRRRSAVKWTLRTLALAGVCAFACGVHDSWVVYNSKSLNEKLNEYQAAAKQIEDLSANWDAVLARYNGMSPYYRLIWSKPVVELAKSVLAAGKGLPSSFQLTGWSLKTCGECAISYRFVFDAAGKAQQAVAASNAIARAMAEIPGVADLKISDIPTENLLNVSDVNIAVSFKTPPPRAFPKKESAFDAGIKMIVNRRQKIHKAKIGAEKGAKTGRDLLGKMQDYRTKRILARKEEFEEDEKMSIDIKGFMDAADHFAADKRLPSPANGEEKKIREEWERVGAAKLPSWCGLFGFDCRDAELDVPELMLELAELRKVRDGVLPMKQWLELFGADIDRKLAPFKETYERREIYNQRIIQNDLIARAAGGDARFSSAFSQQSAGKVNYVAEGEAFTFSWVPWTVTIRNGGKREGSAEEAVGAITLEAVLRYAAAVSELGPGYAIGALRVNFREGEVDTATYEGLLPVRESKAADAK